MEESSAGIRNERSLVLEWETFRLGTPSGSLGRGIERADELSASQHSDRRKKRGHSAFWRVNKLNGKSSSGR